MKRTGFVAVLLLLLAACELLPPDPSGGRQGVETGAPPPEVAVLPPEEQPSMPPAVPEGMDPKRLVGLTREQVTALIGPPKSVSDSAPATVWGYQTDGCTLEVMFYMDLGTQTFRALAYEVRPDRPARLAPPECLARIRAGRDGR